MGYATPSKKGSLIMSKHKIDYLVEKHLIKDTHAYFGELDSLCFLSKNLYNATLYHVRQAFFKDLPFLAYPVINKQFTHEKQPDYTALPAKVAKHTQKLVEKAYRSFFALRKHKDPQIAKMARIPKYLDKAGRQVVHYEKGALSLVKDGLITLSKTNITIKTKLSKKQIEFVRVVPCGNHIMLEVGYKANYPKPLPKGNKIASIDIGLNNLATITSTVATPIIINGKPLKSINQFANKMIAKEQAKLDTKLKISTQRKDKLWLKRKTKISNYLHKASRLIVNYLVANRIDTLVIGKNDGWKQNIDIGKRNNQNFVQIPFTTFIEKLTYKCYQQGIDVVVQEESYTSKCSFLDDEPICKHEIYLGRRIKRGLFKASDGKIINADINGSANILKKYLQEKETWNDCIKSDLVAMCSTSFILKLTPHW